jgi:N-acetylmuramoyl-L-alanine amidase
METLETRLNEVARIAVHLEQETGCPAQLMIAQWAIESAWGAKPVGHANYFGIKKADRHTKCCTMTTREVVNGKSVVENLEFADYDSLEDSCQDYAWLITRAAPYSVACSRFQKDHDLEGLIKAVAQVYATAPSYTDLAIAIANQGNVAGAIARARQKQQFNDVSSEPKLASLSKPAEACDHVDLN